MTKTAKFTLCRHCEEMRSIDEAIYEILLQIHAKSQKIVIARILKSKFRVNSR